MELCALLPKKTAPRAVSGKKDFDGAQDPRIRLIAKRADDGEHSHLRALFVGSSRGDLGRLMPSTVASHGSRLMQLAQSPKMWKTYSGSSMAMRVLSADACFKLFNVHPSVILQQPTPQAQTHYHNQRGERHALLKETTTEVHQQQHSGDLKEQVELSPTAIEVVCSCGTELQQKDLGKCCDQEEHGCVIRAWLLNTANDKTHSPKTACMTNKAPDP